MGSQARAPAATAAACSRSQLGSGLPKIWRAGAEREIAWATTASAFAVLRRRAGFVSRCGCLRMRSTRLSACAAASSTWASPLRASARSRWRRGRCGASTWRRRRRSQSRSPTSVSSAPNPVCSAPWRAARPCSASRPPAASWRETTRPRSPSRSARGCRRRCDASIARASARSLRACRRRAWPRAPLSRLDRRLQRARLAATAAAH
mmetsp:Transcript_39469/g.86742  ORF Transcript_39469/g.86742 Transcript_39469/m.86742 type:complete len:207 (-) Transcript_39469:158-778(-)